MREVATNNSQGHRWISCENWKRLAKSTMLMNSWSSVRTNTRKTSGQTSQGVDDFTTKNKTIIQEILCLQVSTYITWQTQLREEGKRELNSFATCPRLAWTILGWPKGGKWQGRAISAWVLNLCFGVCLRMTATIRSKIQTWRPKGGIRYTILICTTWFVGKF